MVAEDHKGAAQCAAKSAWSRSACFTGRLNLKYCLSGKRVWVAGHTGMVGSALVRRLQREDCELLLAGRDVLDLCERQAVFEWMAGCRPDCILVAAAKVGGIHANNVAPVDFLQQNLMIQNNIFDAAHRHGVARLLFGIFLYLPKVCCNQYVKTVL